MLVKIHQTAFVTGELSTDITGRQDLETYTKGVSRARNGYILPQGGFKRREGLRKIDRVTNNAKGRLVGFEFNEEQAYLMVLTPQEMRVYRDDILQTAVTGYPMSLLTPDILDELNASQSNDTLLLFNQNLKSIRITRTSHTIWNQGFLPFTNIPQFNFGSGNEAVISDTRGWPRCGIFADGRLWLGGLKSRPATMLASKSGDFYNYDKGTGLDDEAIDVTIDSDKVSAIYNFYAGRNLQVFTSGGEWYVQAALDDPITPEKIATQLKRSTEHGSSKIRPVSVDGGTIFTEKGGRVVRQFVYNEVEESYNAANISLLSPHLIRNPIRTAIRRGTDDFPADYVYQVNSDGTVSVLNVLRDEKLLAWSLFETDGLFEDVVEVNNDIYFLVCRTINGRQERFIEKLDPDCKTDCSAIRHTEARPFSPWLWLTKTNKKTAWSGFDHLNGQTCSALGDNYTLDDVTVQNGQVVASESVNTLEVGLPFYAELQLLPVPLMIAGQDYAGDVKRTAYVDLQLKESRGVVVRQPNGKVRRPAFRKFGAAAINTPVQLFSGWKRVHTDGCGKDDMLTITQDAPLELYVLSAKIGIGV